MRVRFATSFLDMDLVTCNPGSKKRCLVSNAARHSCGQLIDRESKKARGRARVTPSPYPRVAAVQRTLRGHFSIPATSACPYGRCASLHVANRNPRKTREPTSERMVMSSGPSETM